jgi:hypothetical protein
LESLNKAERSREFYGAEKSRKTPCLSLPLPLWDGVRAEEMELEEYLREGKKLL